MLTRLILSTPAKTNALVWWESMGLHSRGEPFPRGTLSWQQVFMAARIAFLPRCMFQKDKLPNVWVQLKPL